MLVRSIARLKFGPYLVHKNSLRVQEAEKNQGQCIRDRANIIDSFSEYSRVEKTST